MKPATINELKNELKNAKPAKVLEMCLRLARHKKENKELLTYLIFEADDEVNYVNSVKEETDGLFESMNRSSQYLATKSVRKILRNINKYIRFSGSKQTETELLLYFCRCLKDSGIEMKPGSALSNIYYRQKEKIYKAVGSLHEDLQCDYTAEMEKLEES